MKIPLIAAHRAGNSISGIVGALNDGADIVELDIHMTRDLCLVVGHNPYIIVKNEILYFEDINYSSYADVILSLSEIFDLAITSGFSMLIDIKKGRNFYAHIGIHLAKLIVQYGFEDKTHIISFDHISLLEIKESGYTKLKTGILYVARLASLTEAILASRSDFIEICNEYLDEELIREAQKNKTYLCSWCVNEKKQMEWLHKMGVDIITTDNVSLAVDIIKGNNGGNGNG